MNGIKKKSTVAIAVILLLIMLIVIGKSDTDGYNRTFERGALTALRGQMHVEGDMEAGLFSEGPGVRLMSGTFRFSLYYMADSEGNEVAIYGDGSDETPVYIQSLPISDGIVPAEFVCTFPDEIENLQVRVSYGGQGYFEIIELKIKSEGPICNDYVAITLFCAVLALIFLWLHHMNGDRTGLESPSNRYLLVTGAALLISLPLCTDYIKGGSDFAYHLNRIEGIRAALLSGQFPVRVHANALDGFGYGSPLFYPELLLYIPAILRICGVSLVTSYQIFTVAMNLVAGWAMYLAASRIFGKKEIGLLASILYITAVFRLGAGYYVGLYGWYTSMSFLPLLCLGVYEILVGDASKWMYGTVGFTMVLQTHILSAVLACLMIAVACVVHHKTFFRKERLCNALKAAVLALLLNLWFIVPLVYMMAEPMNLQELSFRFTEFTVPLALLFKCFMEIGFYTMKEGAALQNVVPATIGPALAAANLVLLLPFLWAGMKRSSSCVRERRTGVSMALWGAASLFLMSRLMPWKAVAKIPAFASALTYIQFPWRLFSFALLFLCMSGAAGVWLLVQEYGQWKRTVYVLVMLVSFLPAMYYLNGNNGEHVLLMQTELIDSGQIANGEYLYEGTDINRLSDWAGKVTVQKQEDGMERGVVISDYTKEGGNLSFHFIMDESESEAAYVELPLLYYPGYAAWIDGQRTEVERGEQNVLRLWLLPGTEGTVTVRYIGLRLWNAATWISFVTLAVVITYYGVEYWKKHGKGRNNRLLSDR